MARYPAGPRGRRARNQIYTILAVIIIGVVFVYLYYPFGDNENEPVSEAPLLNANPDFDVPVIRETAVSEPPAQVEPEPVQPDSITVQESSLPDIPTGPTVEPNPEAEALIQEAETLLKKTPVKLIEARDKLNMTLQMPMSVQQRGSVKKKLSELAEKWLFTRTAYPEDLLCGTYLVGKGEILSAIGEKFKVPHQILMQVNNISDPRTLQAGQKIKVIKGPFNVKVYRSSFTMDVYLQTTYVRSFIVGLGLPGQETPTGLWRVAEGGKMEKPIWTNPLNGRTYFPEDPDYPLGSRWIGLEGLEGEAKDKIGFAIHGTKDPQQLGTQGSQGCIRMENGNAILVYNMLFPVESLVDVTD